MSILRTFLRSHAARVAMMAVLYAGSLVAILGMGLILAVDLDKLAVAQLWALLALVLFVLTLMKRASRTIKNCRVVPTPFQKLFPISKACRFSQYF